jgi:hypothetical protein
MFVSGAFGEDEAVWRDVSPVHGGYDEPWQRGGLRTAILGASEGDVLVEQAQLDAMKKSLEEQGWKISDDDSGATGRDEKKELVILPLEGAHDEIWSLGDGVRKSIELAIKKLFPTSS